MVLHTASRGTASTPPAIPFVSSSLSHSVLGVWPVAHSPLGPTNIEREVITKALW